MALPQSIGWGGWDGTTQQVVSLGVDNNITDFNEPMAQDVHGWKGFTFVPQFSAGDLTLQGELTCLDYNTNWQTAWGGGGGSKYPTFEWFTGVNVTTARCTSRTRTARRASTPSTRSTSHRSGKGLEIYWQDQEDRRDGQAPEQPPPWCRTSCRRPSARRKATRRRATPGRRSTTSAMTTATSTT